MLMSDFHFECVPRLETERLLLRRIGADDLPAWLADLEQPASDALSD